MYVGNLLSSKAEASNLTVTKIFIQNALCSHWQYASGCEFSPFSWSSHLTEDCFLTLQTYTWIVALLRVLITACSMMWKNKNCFYFVFIFS